MLQSDEMLIPAPLAAFSATQAIPSDDVTRPQTPVPEWEQRRCSVWIIYTGAVATNELHLELYLHYKIGRHAPLHSDKDRKKATERIKYVEELDTVRHPSQVEKGGYVNRSEPCERKKEIRPVTTFSHHDCTATLGDTCRRRRR